MESIGKLTQGSGAKLAYPAEQAGSGAIEAAAEAMRPRVLRAASGAHRLVDRLAGTTNRAAQQLEETATRMKGAQQRLVGSSYDYVREHPFRSMGIALAAGFLVSRAVISAKSRAGEKSEEGQNPSERPPETQP